MCDASFPGRGEGNQPAECRECFQIEGWGDHRRRASASTDMAGYGQLHHGVSW
jgi:hypothetical protein